MSSCRAFVKLDDEVESAVDSPDGEHGCVQALITRVLDPNAHAEISSKNWSLQVRVSLEGIVVPGAPDHPVVVEVGRGLTRLRHTPGSGGDFREVESELEGHGAVLPALLRLHQRLQHLR